MTQHKFWRDIINDIIIKNNIFVNIASFGFVWNDSMCLNVKSIHDQTINKTKLCCEYIKK